MANRLSFIVPFHRGLTGLARCLAALHPLPPGSELIIAADGAADDCRQLASAHCARIVAVHGPSGPAVARNVAAAAAIGDVLVFIDADVVVSRAGLARMARILREQPQTAAVFGAYDERPDDPGFMSQYKNLAHSFIHQSSATKARTFWTGFGAVRRGPFEMVGGFDERFDRPSVEDIDLGYRLTEGGYEVVLDPTLSACHLKRWTLRSVIVSDVRDRGIPWTQLILRYGVLRNDMNLRVEYRLSVVVAYLALVSLVLALYDWRFLANMALLIVGLTMLNQRYYRFFYRKRGASFTVRVWLLHILHHLYNGLSFATGTTLFIAARYLRLRLPGALSIDSWSATFSRSASATRTSSVWSADPASY
jgi:glycosyltransferase involved in cell wall biosynthesis